jgi:CheY-like chemotaxis protein
MQTDFWAEVVKILPALVASIIWPGIVLFVLIRYGSSIGVFFKNVSTMTLKGAGVEASLSRSTVEAAVALGAAVSKHPPKDESNKQTDKQREIEVDYVSRNAAAWILNATRTVAKAGQHLLWVDDQPGGNNFERKAFEAVGIRIELARDTDEAIKKFERSQYDVIITDVMRPSSKDAGFEFVEYVRQKDNEIPIFMYTWDDTQKNRQRAMEMKANGLTKSPAELFSLVLASLESPTSSQVAKSKRIRD